MPHPAGDLLKLVEAATSFGWNAAMYEHARLRVATGVGLLEDDRVADWRFLLPVLPERGAALVLGCGLGTVPVALSDVCANVHAVDVVLERARLLGLRAAQHGIMNLFPVHIEPGAPLPFESGRFDLVVACSSDWNIGRMPLARGHETFEEAVRDMGRLLAPGGTAYVTAGNRLGYQRLLRPWRRGAETARSLGACRRALAAAGFVRLEVYAPLPSHRGIPLAYVPLEEPAVFASFLPSLLALFETVSAEVKRQYALEYRLARAGVSLAVALGLARLALRFVPGFAVVATRDGRREKAA